MSTPLEILRDDAQESMRAAYGKASDCAVLGREGQYFSELGDSYKAQLAALDALIAERDALRKALEILVRIDPSSIPHGNRIVVTFSRSELEKAHAAYHGKNI